MAADSVYTIVELVGTSPVSWEDAAKKAVEAASKSLRELRIAEIVQQDLKVENGKSHSLPRPHQTFIQIRKLIHQRIPPGKGWPVCRLSFSWRFPPCPPRFSRMSGVIS